MICVSGNDVTVSRGDSLRLNITFTGRELLSGTRAVITISRERGSVEPVIRRVCAVEENAAVFQLTGDETALMHGDYSWDARLLIPDGGEGEVVTPFAPARFQVTEVVGDARAQD